MIFDTNVLIFISKNIIKTEDIIIPGSFPRISVVSYIEALGYSFKADKDEMYMQRICNACQIIGLSNIIIAETIALRKSNKIKLPDAIIYSTALVERQPLLTNNIGDFKKLGNGVQLIDPFTL